MKHTQHTQRQTKHPNDAMVRTIFFMFSKILKIVFQFVVCMFLWNCWHSSLSVISLRCGDPRRTNERAQAHAQRILLQLWTILLIMKLANEAAAKRKRYHINCVGHRKQANNRSQVRRRPTPRWRCGVFSVWWIRMKQQTDERVTDARCSIIQTFELATILDADAKGEKQNMKHSGMEKGRRIGRNENNVLCPCCDWWPSVLNQAYITDVTPPTRCRCRHVR